MNLQVQPRRIMRAKQASIVEPVTAMPALERRRLQCYLAIMCMDIAMFFLGYIAAGWLYLGNIGMGTALVMAQIVLPVYLTIALYNGSFSMRSLVDASHGAARSLIALTISSAVVLFIAFYMKAAQDFSRVVFGLSLLLLALLLPWARAQMRSFVRWRCGHQVINELVIDDGGPDVNLPHVRRIDAEKYGLVPELSDPIALDRIGSILRNVDRVVISCAAERRQAWALILKGANIEGELIDDSVVLLGARGARQAGGHGLLLVSLGPLGLRSRIIKRLFDVTFAGTALLLLSPLLAVVAVMVVLEDGGPALFVQRRMGRGNTFFSMYKFRSMSVERLDHDGNRSTSRNDSRVTRIGKFIRSTSIDELPQLFNVLLGDMSLVGPRPHAIGSQAGNKLFWEVDQRYWLRHALKPGLTGLAQVRGFRGATERESDLASRLNADLEYLNGWSIWRDIKIVFATANVLVHEHAY